MFTSERSSALDQLAVIAIAFVAGAVSTIAAGIYGRYMVYQGRQFAERERASNTGGD